MSAAASRSSRDTIFALSSGQGRAGVAVIRVSGPAADDALRALTDKEPPKERHAVLRTLFDNMYNVQIDTALVLRFSAPHSYTGENVIEFQLHGGPAVVAALLGSLGRLPALRAAEPGEFTRRAVENGKLDLIQAEAIADLVAAETEGQRRQAFRQLEGGLSTLYEDWRSRLIRSAAWIEATIDFPDEEIPPDAIGKSRSALKEIAAEISAHLDDGRRGEILRDGFQVAVIGPPNSGKSSLINALARRDVAIVSAIPGTTRDVIEVRLDLKGYPVLMSDTAGMRAANDEIEQEGIRRAQARAAGADLRLLVLDGSLPDPSLGVDPAVLKQAELVVLNKADLVASKPTDRRPWISARTGEGLSQLIDEIAERASRGLAGEAPAITRARHRSALEEARKEVAEGIESEAAELAAEHLRRALRAIGRISGRVDLDELLDVVFRDFCLGK